MKVGDKYHRTTIKQTAEGVLGISTHLLVYFLSFRKKKIVRWAIIWPLEFSLRAIIWPLEVF